jgi:alpha-ketoglutarate-dependent dioxygenase FTO
MVGAEVFLISSSHHHTYNRKHIITPYNMKKKRKSGEVFAAAGSIKKRKKCDQTPEPPSLAQLLKKQRGVAADTPAPPIWKDKLGRAFLTPDEDRKAFDECLKTSYKGFYFDAPSSLPQSLHRTFDDCFEGLEEGGLFLYDVVQPGKKKLTLTSVTRTLVGDPGSTYKYLGLRLFSHPWYDIDADGNALHLDKAAQVGSSLEKLGYSSRTTVALIAMGCLNKQLTDRSTQKLRQYVSVKPVGSAEFNLTLVNKMESVSRKRDLKKEASYNMGKASVGWHRDSGLKDFSTIAVYQKSTNESPPNTTQQFGVALRAMDGGAGGPLSSVPALLVALPSGSLYFMLDEFNHNHEHAVIAGDDGVRYSSTHRVAREGQGTWQYIRDKIQNLQSSATMFDWSVGKVNDPTLSPKKRKQKLVSRLRNQEALLSEIEFEWLRQWFVQGHKHAQLHPYWHDPIRVLMKSFCELEQSTVQIIKLLREASTKRGRTDSEDLCETLFDVLIESFTERINKRNEWARRYKDPIFRDLAENERPFACPCLYRDEEKRSTDFLPTDLESSIIDLRESRAAFVGSNEQNEERVDAQDDKAKMKTDKKKKKKSSLTRREEKKVASNWNALKSKIHRC